MILLVFHPQLDMDEPLKKRWNSKLKIIFYSFTICWKSQLRITEVALLGRIPRFDDDKDETTVDCFRRFVQNESNKTDEESAICDGPLAIICERGVWPLNSVVYWWQMEFKPSFDRDCFLEVKKKLLLSPHPSSRGLG